MADRVSTDRHEPRHTPVVLLADKMMEKTTASAESVQLEAGVDDGSGGGGDGDNESSPYSPPPTVPFSKSLCFKLDLWLLTPMLFLNFLSLMGRTNIGAALIQGLPTDLRLDAIKTFTVTVMPLVMLILFEVPSNLLMRWLERHWGLSYMRYLSLITVGLGLATLGQAFDQSYGALVATRFLVGIFDAGLIPGCVYVLSLYYPSIHLQWRMSMLMVANLCSNIVSNILAYAIAEIHSANGYHGWRWIFIVEGCLTMAIGLACCASPISQPAKATFLSQQDKQAIAQNVESRSSSASASASSKETTTTATTTIGLAAEWKAFFSNILNYIWATLYVFTCTTTYSLAIFAPTFVQVFHPAFTVVQVQGQVIPIFVVAAAACLLTAWLADRYDHRCGFALAGYLVTIVGYALLVVYPAPAPAPAPAAPSSASAASSSTASTSMLGLYLVAMGSFSSLPLVWTMTCVNLATPFQRAVGGGFVVGLGNVGGFVSAWIFRSSQKPRYHAGMTDALVLTCLAFLLTGFAWVYMVVHNRRLSRRITACATTTTGQSGCAESGEPTFNGRVFMYRP